MDEKVKEFIDKCERSIRPGISQDEIQRLYAEWTSSYDEGVSAEGTYGKAIQKAAELFSNLFPNDKTIKILDISAGTGLLGQALQKCGFSNIDALDLSQEMLNVAKVKQVYQNLICDALGENRLNIEDNTYDAITGTGVFIEGHANQSCFPELIRITKPGGTISLVIGEEWVKKGVLREWEPDVKRLVDDGKWSLVKRDMFPIPYSPLTNGAIQFILKVN